jgi:hypothetical protein
MVTATAANETVTLGDTGTKEEAAYEQRGCGGAVSH